MGALGILTIDGMIDCAITNAKGVTGDAFLLSIYNHLIPHLNPFPGPRSVVLLDNARIHHVEGVVDMIESTGARVVYLPAYSFDLNPIEKAFSKVKAWLCRNRDISRRSPRIALRHAMLQINADDAAGYFRSCGVQVEEILPGLYV